jgi:hypothetical protein
MKGCLKFFAIAAALLVVASFARYFLWLTPEQRAAEAAKYQAETKASADASEARQAAAKADRERIEALKPEFIVWLQKNAGARTGRFDGDVLEVKFDHDWPSANAARVKAESLAHAWRLRSGLDYAKCNIYYGNEIIATGVDRQP